MMDHAQRVAANFPPDSIEHQVAIYHDHLEDNLGLVPDIVRAHVEVLTRGVDEDYRAYIERVRDSGDSVAVAVKLADAWDNLERCHGMHGGNVSKTRGRRYELAIKLLTSTTSSSPQAAATHTDDAREGGA